MWAFSTLGDGIDALKQVELPEPSPGPREVLVRMIAVALNFRDLLVINGVDGWKPTEARIPLSDGVGVVVSAGTEVTRCQPGDRVAGIFLPKWLGGEYHELVPHQRIRNTDKFDDPNLPGEMHVTITLKRVSCRT